MATVAEEFAQGRVRCLVCGCSGTAERVKGEGLSYHVITWSKRGREPAQERWSAVTAPSRCMWCAVLLSGVPTWALQ